MPTGREIYEESCYLAAAWRGVDPWPAWHDLDPQQRMNYEALAHELTQKAVADHEAERAASAKRTEVPYA